MPRYATPCIAAVILLAPAVARAQVATVAASLAATPSQAVEEYIRAASDSNLTRMRQRFGTDKGNSYHIKIADIDKRMLITHAYLVGTKVEAVSDVSAGKSNERTISASITRGSCRVVIPVTAVRSDHDGWLVRNMDLERTNALREKC